MTTMVASYRIFSLPQASNGPEERRFRRALVIGIGLWLFLVLVVEKVPTPERSKELEVPESVKIMMQAPPPKPIEQKKPEEKPKEEDQPKPEPVKDKEVAKAKAQKEIDKIKDQLAAVKDVLKIAEPVTDAPDAKVDGPTIVDKTGITSDTSGGPTGISGVKLGTGVTAGGNQKFAHVTGTVPSGGVADMGSGTEPPKPSSGKTGRSREEVDQTLDKNKSALYALYSRAVRANSDMQGLVNVKMIIAPTGEVSDCRIISSELKNEDFEKSICERIKRIKFDSKDVPPMELTKSYNFTPAG